MPHASVAIGAIGAMLGANLRLTVGTWAPERWGAEFRAGRCCSMSPGIRDQHRARAWRGWFRSNRLNRALHA
jgi:hypothetical protein